MRHTIDKATSQLLHDIFNHASMEKIFQTLGVTKGYKQVRLPDFHCDACPQAKARRRFDLEKIRPFEIMFVDNKDYDGPVRGNIKTALVFIDLKTRTKFKIDLATKKSNGTALSRIVAMNGIHKLPSSVLSTPTDVDPWTTSKPPLHEWA